MNIRVILLIFVLFCLGHCGGVDDHEPTNEHHEDEHGHEEHSETWEWAGVFTVHTTEPYTWVANKVNGSYASDEMLLLILPTSSPDKAGILAATSEAQRIWQNDGEPVLIHPAATATITPGALHLLHFETEVFASMFPILFAATSSSRAADDEANFVIFTQHDPAEFEGSIHYLVDSEGNDVEPGATDPEETVERKAPVGEAIGAAFCVAIASFIGVVVLVPGFAWVAGRFSILSAIDAFASGALIALIFFIVVPESLASIASAYPIETQTAAWFGSAILLGFLTPILLDWFTVLIFPNAGHAHGHAAFADDATKESDKTLSSSTTESLPVSIVYPEFDPDRVPEYFPTPVSSPMAAPFNEEAATIYMPPEEEKGPAPVPKRQSMWRGFFHCCPLSGVAWSIIIGDGLHNFTDGVLLGVGFKLCGSSMGWSIAGASVVHELASELSEFWLLINPEQGKLTWLQAIALNFFSSLTVVWGCLIVSFIDITPFTLGLLLGFGGGLLLCIATVSIWSRILQRTVSLFYVIIMVFFFTFGAVAIGLVLLSHLHCDAEGGAHAGHEGHGH